jgi:dihydroorotate dehydrogenase subfamily 2
VPTYPHLRSILFRLEPERAHALSLAALDGARRFGLKRVPRFDPSEALQCLGLRFPNRIGLAAGFDKHAQYVDALGALGFGFIEVGTVTPRPQPGQPRPRLFRWPEQHALINRMGFPNDGAQVVAARLARRTYSGICGVNIGKNATTPLEEASRDYVECLSTVGPHADYVAINVSSPNTPDLRRLQHTEQLEPMLQLLLAERDRIASARGRALPLLVKISPDSSDEDIGALARMCRSVGLDGVIATNTTVSRPTHAVEPRLESVAREGGGLSGAPLRPLALRTISVLRQELGRALPIIGVGGIDGPSSALDALRAGADLVQVYTGLIYRGPRLVADLRKGLGVVSGEGAHPGVAADDQQVRPAPRE